MFLERAPNQIANQERDAFLSVCDVSRSTRACAEAGWSRSFAGTSADMADDAAALSSPRVGRAALRLGGDTAQAHGNETGGHPHARHYGAGRHACRLGTHAIPSRIA